MVLVIERRTWARSDLKTPPYVLRLGFKRIPVTTAFHPSHSSSLMSKQLNLSTMCIHAQTDEKLNTSHTSWPASYIHTHKYRTYVQCVVAERYSNVCIRNTEDPTHTHQRLWDSETLTVRVLLRVCTCCIYTFFLLSLSLFLRRSVECVISSYVSVHRVDGVVYGGWDFFPGSLT